MAQEYVALKQNNTNGMIALSKTVFQQLAKIAVDEDEELILNEGVAPFKTPLTCKIQDDQLILTLEVKVKYNVNVNEACSRLQARIFESIQHMSDYKPDVIDVRVVGFVF